MNEYKSDSVSPPGETLQEVLDTLGISSAVFSENTQCSNELINGILEGKNTLSNDIALQFERVLGIPASFWINRELQYRESLNKQE